MRACPSCHLASDISLRVVVSLASGNFKVLRMKGGEK